MDLSKLDEFGLAGAVIAILFFIIWKILVWVMSFVKTITEQHKEERREWLGIMNELKTSINLHNQSSIESRKSSEEAHKFQREEHKAQLDSMKQVEQALGRINGYKHD